MAVSIHAEGLATPSTSFGAIGTTDDTTAGVFQLVVDCNALGVANTLGIQISEKARTSDPARVVLLASVSGPQSEPLWVSPPLMLISGWTMRLKCTATINFPWSIRKAG